MKLRGTIFTVLASIAVSHTQAVNISGVVKNSGGTVITGAMVRLGKANLSTTTGADGSFTLTGNITGATHQSNHGASSDERPFLLDGGRFFFGGIEPAEVRVMAYDCNGRLLLSRVKVTSANDRTMALPYLASGIHIYRISINTTYYTFKSVSGTAAAIGPGASWNMIVPARQTKAAAPIDDALLFTKSGYQLYRLPIKKSDTSGIQATLTAFVTGTVTDADGNSYQTLQYGKQVWTVENLRTTKYNDGSNIGSGCAFYNNATDAAAKKKWGALYSGSTAISSKLAPTGWRVPTNADWDELQKFLIANGYNYDGTTTDTNLIAKSMCATTDWKTFEDRGSPGNDPSNNNSSGFSALPGGVHDFSGTYFDQNLLGWWWTSSTKDASFTYARAIMYTSFDLNKSDRVPSNGFSIRLVKNI
jgi:uncharacterized protein (TIGR02145 family)